MLIENDPSSNMRREPRPPRLWNSRILPNYAAIAVDERTPEYPFDVIVQRGHVDRYHNSYHLLDDRPYVRFLRLRFESMLNIDTELTNSVNLALGVQIMLDNIPNSSNINQSDRNFDAAALQAIAKDYFTDPTAMVAINN